MGGRFFDVFLVADCSLGVVESCVSEPVEGLSEVIFLKSDRESLATANFSIGRISTGIKQALSTRSSQEGG